jgi:hypothetical protein
MALPEHNNSTREKKEAEEPRRAKKLPTAREKRAHTQTNARKRRAATEMKETWARPKVQPEKATVARWAAATAAHAFSIFYFSDSGIFVSHLRLNQRRYNIES